MAVVVVGIHERDAPLELFEKVAFAEGDLVKALNQLTDSAQLSEAVLLSTCMRTEIYAVVERFHDGLGDIETWLRSRVGDGLFDPALVTGDHRQEPGGGVLDLGGPFVCWFDDVAVSHLFEVAAGIDSPVIGEGEVLRQVKDAAELARSEGAAGPVLGTLFRHAVEVGKRVRTETGIQRGTTSLAHSVVELAADQALGFEGKRLLVLGAGEMGASIAKALAGRSDLTGEIVVANRGEARGQSVADLVAGRAASIEDLPEELARADVILSSTAATDAVLTSSQVAAALARRDAGRPPLVIVDAAVPRDVEPSVSSLEGAELLDMEDVRRYAEEQMAGREAELPAVRAVLAEELERYKTLVAGRLAAPVVSAMRERAEQVRSEEIAWYSGRLEALDAADRELLETITRRVVAKLLHEPTVRVKDAAGSPRGERLAEALRTLFDL